MSLCININRERERGRVGSLICYYGVLVLRALEPVFVRVQSETRYRKPATNDSCQSLHFQCDRGNLGLECLYSPPKPKL